MVVRVQRNCGCVVPEFERPAATGGVQVHVTEHRTAAGRRPHALTHCAACEELRRELGVYLVGAIGPADRSTLASHLASCSSCRNQLADLAGLPGLLRRVPFDDVNGQVPASGSDGSNALPDWFLESLLRQVARRKRSRVWLRLIPQPRSRD